jgi:hypothetical protein
MASATEPTRGFELLALTCMTLGAAAWLWETLALQAPSSPWHMPGMPLAVARLALHAWVMGLAAHSLSRGVALPRWVLTVSVVGVTLSLGAQAVSAATGLLGVQVRDLRAGSGWVLGARTLGGAALAVAFGGAVAQRLRRG